MIFLDKDKMKGRAIEEKLLCGCVVVIIRIIRVRLTA